MLVLDVTVFKVFLYEFLFSSVCDRVRERNEPGSFALSVCFNGIVYHYKIDKDCTGQLFIKDGPKFDSLLQVSVVKR